jgi:hypothetical protein
VCKLSLLLLPLVLHVLQQHRCGELVLGLLHELRLLQLLHRVCLLLLQVLSQLLLLFHGRGKKQLCSRGGLDWLQRREILRVRWRRDDEARTVVRLTRRRSVSRRRACPHSPLDASVAAPRLTPQ